MPDGMDVSQEASVQDSTLFVVLCQLTSRWPLHSSAGQIPEGGVLIGLPVCPSPGGRVLIGCLSATFLEREC